MTSLINLAINKALPLASAAKWQQWSDRPAMLNHKTLPPSGPLSYLHSSALKTLTSYWKREGSAGMDMLNAQMVQSRQPFTYRLMESVGIGGPRWLGSSWQRGIAQSGSSQLSTLRIEALGDLVWDLPCVQQASTWKAAHCCGYCPCTCTLIKNPMMMMMMMINWWWWWWSIDDDDDDDDDEG